MKPKTKFILLILMAILIAIDITVCILGEFGFINREVTSQVLGIILFFICVIGALIFFADRNKGEEL